MIYALLDRLTERYSENEHRLEAMRAREEYFDRAGKVFDDDAELFEGRMASFLEWYVLERPSAGLGKTPISPILHAVENGTKLPGEERRALAHLASSHRSLFQLASAAERVLEIDDLLGGARFSVLERRNTAGVAEGDLFEARVIWDGERAIFGRTFLFHPPDAREVAIDWVERVVAEGMPRAEILFHLSRQYVRWHRLGHIGAAKVYRDAG
ncbi:MAG TPA: hypothetical protein VH853_06345 [Polyangia bacterium]|jgi:hypothetical protein|nr:hypothetical protein [Polyangia bacterium]